MAAPCWWNAPRGVLLPGMNHQLMLFVGGLSLVVVNKWTERDYGPDAAVFCLVFGWVSVVVSLVMWLG